MNRLQFVETPRFICLTPTRNESWIIDRFLSAAGRWADEIIIADQGSSDGTLEKILAKPNVRLVCNDWKEYNEQYRQQLLLREAREIDGKRIFIALDADEALSATCKESAEWDKIAQAAPGTVLRFRWVNVLPGFDRVWVGPELIPCGFVDDGSQHDGLTVHSPRVPIPANAPVLDLQEVVVLHFQFVVPERVASKHRWYQAWEYAEHRRKGALDIFRMYNHMNGSWRDEEIIPFDASWLIAYERAGIDYRSLCCEDVTWWDREILGMLGRHGPEKFRKVQIWDKDWNSLARRSGLPDGRSYSDPRRPWEKLAHRLLACTQEKREQIKVRILEKSLRLLGW